MNLQDEEIQVRVEHVVGTKFSCAKCQQQLAGYDHAKERKWRHLDSCQFKTILIGRVPRLNCPDHGVKTVTAPWACAVLLQLFRSRPTIMPDGPIYRWSPANLIKFRERNIQKSTAGW
jgi:transposase